MRVVTCTLTPIWLYESNRKALHPEFCTDWGRTTTPFITVPERTFSPCKLVWQWYLVVLLGLGSPKSLVWWYWREPLYGFAMDRYHAIGWHTCKHSLSYKLVTAFFGDALGLREAEIALLAV